MNNNHIDNNRANSNNKNTKRSSSGKRKRNNHRSNSNSGVSKMSSTTTYTMTATGGAVKRIRTPHPHDVLSGRGGGINSHVGNKTFREWVRERKEAYNLAMSKAEKARVANEVIHLVKSLVPPGRFLQRDPTTMTAAGWWVEIDDTKALAKTSQALREGAPQIRAAHKDELIKRTPPKHSRRKKASVAPSASTRTTDKTISQSQQMHKSAVEGARAHRTPPQTTATPVVHPAPTQVKPIYETGPSTIQQPPKAVDNNTTNVPTVSINSNVQAVRPPRDQHGPRVASGSIVAPLMSNRQFDEKYLRPTKRVRMEEEAAPVSATAETPPLLSMPAPPTSSIPPLDANAMPPNPSRNGQSKKLIRTHSLALSDMSVGESYGTDEDFVNPFADESDIIGRNESPAKLLTSTNLRNLSSSAESSELNNNKGWPPSMPLAGSCSTRSISELSDLPDTSYDSMYKTDFMEGVKLIHDAVFPDITSPEKEDWIPTHLMPWRGGNLLRGTSSASLRSASSRGLDGRQ